MKQCRRCRKQLPLTDFYRRNTGPDGYQYRCKVCTREYAREIYWRHRGRIKQERRLYFMSLPPDERRRRRRRYGLAYKYGMTEEQFDALWAVAAGRCQICAETVDLCIDHNHKTDAVRGLLCKKCNSLLGMGRDDPAILRAAADYLEKYLGLLQAA